MYDWILAVSVVAATAFGLVQLRPVVRRGAERPPLTVRDRAEVFTVLATDVLMLLLGRALVDWAEVPVLFWLTGLVLTVASVGLAGASWAHLPWLASSRPWLRGISVGLQLVAAFLLGAVLI